jgi:hypothetical protein
MDNLDYLKQHDYFADLRKVHLEQLGAEKKRLEKLRKEKERVVTLSWRKVGDETFSNLKSEVFNLRRMLHPREWMKKCMALFENYCNFNLAFNNISPSTKILAACRNDRRPKKFYNITNLVEWKVHINKEICYRCNEKSNPWDRVFYPPKSNTKTFRTLFRYYMQFIHIDKKLLSELRKKRYNFKRAVQKQNMIWDTQEACRRIGICKSYQHFNPKGCSNCGVIFIGGELEGAVPYVKSISRDTGVATLVTLQFELETLEQEDKIQKVVVSKLGEELQSFEHEVYSTIVTSLQKWWRIILVWKRVILRRKKKEKSLYRYRLRRLVKMKREIDLLIKEPAPLDMNYLGDKYWDFMAELIEYVCLQQDLKAARILKYSRKFQRKLVVIVEEARERRYLEWLRLQSLPKPEKPIIIKRLRAKSPRKLVCYRPECQLRSFLTVERYETHMAVHRKDDLIRYEKYDHDNFMKAQRDAKEKTFLSNVNDSRLLLSKTAEQHRPLVDSGLDEPNLRYPHGFWLYEQLNCESYYLELVSKHSNVVAETKISLNSQVTRIGVHDTCEGFVQTAGEIGRKGMISKIHCLLYHSSYDVDVDPGKEFKRDHSSSLIIVDNNSKYGTYVVEEAGAFKVPSKVSKGLPLKNGSLICIGVCLDGPQNLPITEANSACLVFRLQKL